MTGGPPADPDDPAGFIPAELIGTLALVAAMVAALVWANLGGGRSYHAFFDHPVNGFWGRWFDVHSVRDVVNTVLMTVFFLAVGLEVGRERVNGALRDNRRALLPVAAALGGMAGAALTYLLVAALSGGGDAARSGWGVPMATDVAFTLAAIALLGRRVPSGIRVFVLALAVADDVASVVVLAGVSADGIRPLPLVGAIALLVVVGLVLRRRVTTSVWPYLGALVVLWILLAWAKVEPPLAGAFLGMLVPCALLAQTPGASPIAQTPVVPLLTQTPGASPITQTPGVPETPASMPPPSPAARIERFCLPLSTWVILPLFALANTGVTLRAAMIQDPVSRSVLISVIVARLVGKLVGIVGITALLVWVGAARLPEGSRWSHIAGIGALCGMGFTVPLLFAEAAFGGTGLDTGAAEAGLLLGTVLAGGLGVALLARAGRPTDKTA